MSGFEDYIYFAAPPLPYLLESGYSDYKPGDEHPNRRHIGIFDLIIVETGCLNIGEDNRRWSLMPGESLLLLPDRYHYSVKPCEKQTLFHWVHFQTVGGWTAAPQDGHAAIPYEEHYERFLTAPYALQLQQKWSLPYPEQAYRLMRDLQKSNAERQSSAFWIQQQTFEEVLRMMDLRQNEAFTSPAVMVAEKTAAYIKNNYQSALSSKMMADALSYHYNYITRCMKAVYGVTPADYLTAYRLEQAKLLLLKTEWPVAKIAQYVGFENAPYFTNCFTRSIGIPPTKFRKQYISPETVL